MDQSGGEFSKLRWVCTVLGMIFFTLDFGSDLLLSAQYFVSGHHAWFGLNVSFVLVGSLCAQIFSYSWFIDDLKRRGELRRGERASTPRHLLLHLLQLGFYRRYWDILKKSFATVWHSRPGDCTELLEMAADLSMLRLIETFLESVPQLLLQSYVIFQYHHTSELQYLSMGVSLLNVAWSVVDFWRCLRRSLPGASPMPHGPTLVYLLYKVLTLCARILSYTLLIVLSRFSMVALGLVWVVGTLWAYVVQTDFCTSRGLEQLYRCIIGVILVFTFFNVEGQRSRRAMSLYYALGTLVNLAAPVLLWLLHPGSEQVAFLVPVAAVIATGNVMGLVFLVLYYSALHPRSIETDEPDGGRQISDRTPRVGRFLKLGTD